MHPRPLLLVTSFFALSVLAGCGSDSESSSSGGGGSGVGGSGATGGSGGGGGGGAGGGSGGTAGGGGTGGGTCTLSSAWQVVDDFLLTPGENSFIVGIAADDGGNVYAVGLGKQGTSMLGVVRKGANAGTSWTSTNWGEGAPNDVAVDDAGTLYVAAGYNGRVVRKSVDGGTTWNDIDSYQIVADVNEPCNTGFVAVGPNGVVVDGASCDSSGWVVRKTSGSAPFQQVFSYQMVAGKKARLERVGVGPSGAAFGMGASLDANDVAHWMTVTDGAATGTVSDDFQLVSGNNAGAYGTSEDSAGLVTGYAEDATGSHGVLRRLEGASWVTLDTFGTRASDVVQLANTLIVTGVTGALDQVVTRISTDDGATFSPLDADYSYVVGKATRSGALTHDGIGNFYAAIAAVDGNDVTHWIIRKLPCE